MGQQSAVGPHVNRARRHGSFGDLSSRTWRLFTLVVCHEHSLALVLLPPHCLDFPLCSRSLFCTFQFLFYSLFLLPYKFGLYGPPGLQFSFSLIVLTLPHGFSLGTLSTSALALPSFPFLLPPFRSPSSIFRPNS